MKSQLQKMIDIKKANGGDYTDLGAKAGVIKSQRAAPERQRVQSAKSRKNKPSESSVDRRGASKGMFKPEPAISSIASKVTSGNEYREPSRNMATLHTQNSAQTKSLKKVPVIPVPSSLPSSNQGPRSNRRQQLNDQY